MIESICPVAEFLVVGFLHFAALIEGVAEIVMTFGLQTGIRREQRLAEGFQRFIVVLQFVSGGA